MPARPWAATGGRPYERNVYQNMVCIAGSQAFRIFLPELPGDCEEAFYGVTTTVWQRPGAVGGQTSVVSSLMVTAM